MTKTKYGELMETIRGTKDVEITDSQIKKIKDYLAYAAEDGNYYRNSQNTGEILEMGEMDHFFFNIEFKLFKISIRRNRHNFHFNNDESHYFT